MLLCENCIDSTPRRHVLARGRLMAYCGEGIRRMVLTMTATGIREEMAMNWSRQRRQLKVRHNFQFGSCSRFCNPNPFSEFVPRIISEAASHVKVIGNNVVEDNRKFSTGEQCSDIARNSNYRHVSSSSITKSALHESPDSGNGRQSDERNSSTENGSQAESDVGLGDSTALECNGRNGQDIPLRRKRRWRPKRKKKNACAAGIAIYDSHTNSVRLKESVTETPTQCVNLKQQLQRNPSSSKRQLIDQGMQSVEAKVVWQASSSKEVTECARELYSVSRSKESFLGIGEAARLPGLVGLQETGNTQPTIECDKGAPNQECAADVPEVVLKRIRGRKFTEAFKASNINGFDQNSQSAKKISQAVGFSRKTRTPSTVNGAQQQPSSFTPNRSVQSMFGASLGKIDEQVQQVQANASFKKSVTTADQVMESKSLTSNSVTKSVTTPAAELSNSLIEISEDDVDMKDEFESNGSDRPEFLGLRGLNSYKVLQDDQGILVMIRNFYFFMMKQPLPNFAMGMVAAPLALSMVFTLLYFPEFHGLAYDETARDFLKAADGNDGGATGLKLSWMTVFQVFMFSLSLSTGLQPDLAPLSPYTLVVANLNALLAQLILAFLSAAVFARLSQPSQPVRCSSVALIYSLKKPTGQKGQGLKRVLVTRCVLSGPQLCELINVKVDLTYKFNTVSSVGSFLSSSYSLKLVRSQVALLDQGMMVRHIIDATSPLYFQTPESLCQDDAIFVLSVAGMERSSMQHISHVQFYSVCEEQDAGIEDVQARQ